jgi:hypothetical protein
VLRQDLPWIQDLVRAKRVQAPKGSELERRVRLTVYGLFQKLH